MLSELKSNSQGSCICSAIADEEPVWLLQRLFGKPLLTSDRLKTHWQLNRFTYLLKLSLRNLAHTRRRHQLCSILMTVALDV